MLYSLCMGDRTFKLDYTSVGYIWFVEHVRAYSGLKTGVCALHFLSKP